MTTEARPVLGVQMMLRDQVAREGMWPVLERLAALDLAAVEVSQIPMDAATRMPWTADHASWASRSGRCRRP